MTESLRDSCATVLRRDYRHRNGNIDADLRMFFHDPGADKPLSGHPLAGQELLERLCVEAGVMDGDEFEVFVTATGKRPHGDRFWIEDTDVMGHRAETDDECLERIEKHGDKEESVAV